MSQDLLSSQAVVETDPSGMTRKALSAFVSASQKLGYNPIGKCETKWGTLFVAQKSQWPDGDLLPSVHLIYALSNLTGNVTMRTTASFDEKLAACFQHASAFWENYDKVKSGEKVH